MNDFLFILQYVQPEKIRPHNYAYYDSMRNYELLNGSMNIY